MQLRSLLNASIYLILRMLTWKWCLKRQHNVGEIHRFKTHIHIQPVHCDYKNIARQIIYCYYTSYMQSHNQGNQISQQSGPERDPRSKRSPQLGRMHEQQDKHPPNWTTQNPSRSLLTNWVLPHNWAHITITISFKNHHTHITYI